MVAISSTRASRWSANASPQLPEQQAASRCCRSAACCLSVCTWLPVCLSVHVCLSVSLTVSLFDCMSVCCNPVTFVQHVKNIKHFTCRPLQLTHAAHVSQLSEGQHCWAAQRIHYVCKCCCSEATHSLSCWSCVCNNCS